MTAHDLVQAYMEYYLELPPVGDEVDSVLDFARRQGDFLDMPEDDSIIAVGQMLRRDQEEKLRAQGQATLF